MSKRTLDAFFKPKPTTTSTKRAKPNSDNDTSHTDEDIGPPDTHPSYPIPIPQLPSHISISLTHGTPAKEARAINNQPDLDLLYFQPYITRPTANELFKFLRRELPFYRVQYTIKRGGVETDINTPRYTTVFGVDDTAQWTSNPTIKQSESNDEPSPSNTTTTNPPNNNQQPTSTTPFSELTLIETTSKTPIRTTKYQYTPRPLPTCLHHLKTRIESTTGSRYNFCLVNYYSSGADSISFHSDDERFLGANPDIASLSLGGERDFVMKHKPTSPTNAFPSTATGGASPASANLKFPLSSGDMLIMRGPTQSNWLHSIPKRTGRSGDAVRGRINITFRRARVPGGTNNYYHYNVGSGPVWRWDEKKQEMVCTGAGGDGDGGLEEGGKE